MVISESAFSTDPMLKVKLQQGAKVSDDNFEFTLLVSIFVTEIQVLQGTVTGHNYLLWLSENTEEEEEEEEQVKSKARVYDRGV